MLMNLGELWEAPALTLKEPIPYTIRRGEFSEELDPVKTEQRISRVQAWGWGDPIPKNELAN